MSQVLSLLTLTSEKRQQQAKVSEEQLRAQREKTAALIQANKAAASAILKNALAQLGRETVTSRSVSKTIWI